MPLMLKRLAEQTPIIYWGLWLFEDVLKPLMSLCLVAMKK